MTGTLASRVRSVEVLDRFASHHAPCMYAASPSRSVRTRHPLLESGVRGLEHDMGNLIHEKECLEVWPYTVLPPPEIEDRAKPLEKVAAEASRERRRAAARGR
jgi:hypothetical protein